MLTLCVTLCSSAADDGGGPGAAAPRPHAPVPDRARRLSQILREMERTGPGRVRRVPALTDVPLPAQQHRHLSQAHAAARLHLITTR